MHPSAVLAKKLAHARRRFDERYGIRLDDNLSKRIIEQIQNRDQAERICFVSHRVSVWLVHIPANKARGPKENVKVPVVYDKNRKMIATVLDQRCTELEGIDLNEIELEIQ